MYSIQQLSEPHCEYDSGVFYSSMMTSHIICVHMSTPLLSKRSSLYYNSYFLTVVDTHLSWVAWTTIPIPVNIPGLICTTRVTEEKALITAAAWEHCAGLHQKVKCQRLWLGGGLILVATPISKGGGDEWRPLHMKPCQVHTLLMLLTSCHNLLFKVCHFLLIALQDNGSLLSQN